jgi:ATP-dependent Lhr-like helicase
VDRLRSYSGGEPRPGEKPVAVTLAATDPANPYGAALPWPDRGDGGHRPGRKAGALVVLVDGDLAMYVERGGRTLLTFPAVDDEDRLSAAVESLGAAVRNGALGRLTVEKADGAGILSEQGESLRRALESAGFVATTKGLRLRG